MAVNPNTGTPQGPAGWGLNPLGTPSVSTQPLAPPAVAQFTPEQIAQMRKEAMALQTPQQEPIRHWTQGLAELVRAIQGNREADFAREREATGRTQGAQDISEVYKPYLSPGGQPPPSATGAAPAGARGDATPAGGSTVASASAPRGIRNNNPLNIEDGDFARAQPGYVGTDGRFAKFASQDHGVAAANSLLDVYGNKHGLNTVAGIVGRWAPASDHNNTSAYAADVAAQLGIGPNDPIPPSMRPQLIAAMAKHENGMPLPRATAATAPPAAAPPAGPTATGLLAPVPPAAPPTAAAPPPVPANQASAAPATPTKLAYAGDTLPPGMLPTQGGQAQAPAPATPPQNPLVTAIRGGAPANTGPATPLPPVSPTDVPDFAKQAALLAAKADRGPAVPMSPDQGAAATPQPPNPNFAAQVAALRGAADRGPAVPLAPGQTNLPGFPPPPPGATASPPAETAATPPSPVPLPTPRPTVPLATGDAIPGAAGPTSAGGAPLAPTPEMLAAISGQPAGTGGAPNGGAPVRVAQNGMPTAAIPAAATAPAPAAPGGPAGLPQPLTAPTGQVTQDQLTRVLANPWVPQEAKAAMLQMIQQRGQPQIMDVEGGKLMYDAAGHKVFIPEPKFGSVKIGSAEIPTVSHFDPAANRWNTTTLAPGGGVQTTPAAGGAPAGHPALPQQGGTPTAEPDLSSIAGIQAEEARQAGAKKAAEAGGEAGAKYYDSLHKGLAGSAMIAAQQKQNLDVLRQVAASPDFTPGPGSDAALGIQRLASSLGINPTGAAPRELFNQVATRVLADQISGIKSMASETGETGGRIFKTMLDLEEKANITPQDSGPGISAKLNLIDNAGNLMMKWADLADDYVKEHGKLDAGFDKQLRSEIAKARLPNAVPQAEKPAPVSKVVNGKTYYQIGNDVYDNPEGK